MAPTRNQEGDRWRKDARVIKTRAALRSALISLLARHDFPDITVAMIVEEANVGYATFFRHFPDQTALLTDIADATISEFMTTMMPTLLSADRVQVTRALVDFIAERTALCRALLIGGGDVVRRDAMARAIAYGSSVPVIFDPDIPLDLAVTHAVNAIFSTVAWWLGPGRGMKRDTFAEMLERLAMAPVRS
ncbi:TetR/AcrR family transcriptional regulator [Sphingomonas crocodyli]|uniref:TetR/AcrR family transcriptional regulator n=1 Tax=Sphingomonas crocodyli TaxID=1979270 RepID=UPI0013E3382F|nr:TetR/AcrR family transcriptional regulator [Sphingomonas crocodyli]